MDHVRYWIGWELGFPRPAILASGLGSDGIAH